LLVFRVLLQVTIFVGDDAKYAVGKPHVKAFSTPVLQQLDDFAKVKGISKMGPIEELDNIFNLQKGYCDGFLSNPAVLSELKTTDVVVGDSFYPCSSLVAAKFDIPHVVVLESPLGTPTMQLYGVSLM